jgi:NAD(P)-dependent dehydrogenase (short-subunit alcohol dehydrogenase family)
VLANSAGGVFDNNVATVDGFETTFQVNHLAPFLLTPLLTDKLIASRASVLRTTTVRGGLVNRLNLDRLDHVTDSSPIQSYSAAKLENVLFAKELHRRFASSGLASAVFFPGSVATSFGAGTTKPLMRFLTGTR